VENHQLVVTSIAQPSGTLNIARETFPGVNLLSGRLRPENLRHLFDESLRQGHETLRLSLEAAKFA